uniref:mitogen-activated protein kinase kinase n=1 Tax=Steinernema glaseri TaxID=37863 RepID=A0A1I7Z4I8_9BILA
MAGRPNFGGGLGLKLPDPADKYAEDTQDLCSRFQRIKRNSGILDICGIVYRNVTMTDLKELNKLGQGSYGEVKKMQLKEGGQVMAVKKMVISNLKEEESKRILTDLEIVSNAHNSPNIVRCYGYIFDKQHVHILMECMATCLDTLLKKIGQPFPEAALDCIACGIGQPFPEAALDCIACGVLDGLNYLKAKFSVIHRDVKPSNILLDFNGTVKLCDFGISGHLVNSLVKTNVGCIGYMSPERIERKDAYDVRSDVWSFGLSLVELARGVHPYADVGHEFQLLSAIVEQPAPVVSTDEGFSDLFVDFVTLCLNKNPEHRPKYPTLLKHQYILRARCNRFNMEEWLSEAMTVDNDMI